MHCAPLAFCDPRSVRTEDIVEVDKVSPQLIEMGYFLKYRPYHRWYWMPQQKSDEPVLFVSWDPTSQVDQAGEYLPYLLFDAYLVLCVQYEQYFYIYLPESLDCRSNHLAVWSWVIRVPASWSLSTNSG